MNRPYRRRLRIVDHTLQRSLLVALVLMEAVVVSAAIWALYRALGEIVDAATYRIHFHDAPPILGQLVAAGWRVLGAMLAVNFCALIAADRIWVHYVRSILRQLACQVQAAARLDLAAQAQDGCAHAVLDQVAHWRALEAARLLRGRVQLRALPAMLPATAGERAVLIASLDADA